MSTCFLITGEFICSRRLRRFFLQEGVKKKGPHPPEMTVLYIYIIIYIYRNCW